MVNLRGVQYARVWDGSVGGFGDVKGGVWVWGLRYLTAWDFSGSFV